MANLAVALRELHRIHKQLSDLKDRLERGPRQVKAAEANVKKSEADFAQARDTYRQAKIAADEKQLQLKQREAKLADWQVKLMQAASNKEYQLLKDQIAADGQANSVLADEILEALERLDVLQAGVKTSQEQQAKAQEELAKVKHRVAEQQAVLETELARVTDELHRAEESVPADFRADYLRIARVRGEESLAPVEGETCGGCYQTLTPQTMEVIRQYKPLFCKSCGRLLYLPE
jgi:predicted  nucleic acid-binding Zn-ribbon protein